MRILDEPYERSRLNEGRESGIGYTIFHKDSANNLKPMHPFSTCKDYLNDFIYVENSEKELEQIHGFKHNFTNYFKYSKLILGVKPLKYVGNGSSHEWEGYLKSSEIFQSNHENFIKLLDFLEEKIFKVSNYNKTKFLGIIEDTWILELSPIWSKTPFSISFITLFIRCFFNYDDDINLEDIKDHDTFIADDEMLISEIFDVIENEKTKEEMFDWDKYIKEFQEKENSDIHNSGIQYLNNRIRTQNKEKLLS